MTATFHSNKPIELPSIPKKKPSTAFSQFDLACAKQLHRIVFDQLQKRNRWSSSKWADEFRLLRQTATEDQITFALDWYQSNCQNSSKKCPSLESAAGFRRHWKWLSECVDRDAPLTVTISLDAHDLAATLRRERWPMGSDKQLGAVIQLSLDAYSAILKQTHQLWKDHKAQDAAKPSPKQADRYLLFLEEVWKMFFTTSKHFVERWMIEVHKSVADWSGWNGDLRSHVFTFDHPKFQRMGQRFASNYCGRDDEWNRYCQELRNEVGKT